MSSHVPQCNVRPNAARKYGTGALERNQLVAGCLGHVKNKMAPLCGRGPGAPAHPDVGDAVKWDKAFNSEMGDVSLSGRPLPRRTGMQVVKVKEAGRERRSWAA